MATKSIYKTVRIKDSKSARKLVRALDDAAAKPGCIVSYSRSVSDANADEVRKMFGKVLAV